MHNHLGLPNEEDKSGFSLIATLLAGKPKMLWTYNIYIISPKLKLCSVADYPWLNTSMTLITNDNSS